MHHRSARRIGGDFNFCGYDPGGVKAHIVAHLYGPGYHGTNYPAHSIPTRFSGRSRPPPRYGSPNQQQIPWLPANFVPRSPPLYFGRPCGPYLPAPLHFDSEIIGALISRSRRPRVPGHGGSGLPEGNNLVNEVKAGGE